MARCFLLFDFLVLLDCNIVSCLKGFTINILVCVISRNNL